MDTAEWHMWWKRSGGVALRAILLSEWDPIGIADEPEAQDEYDSYLGGVSRLLREGASNFKIARFLNSLRGHMGLEPNPRRDYRTAVKARRWYIEQMQLAERKP